VLAPGLAPETRLLAGDHFYAQGLHIIAGHADLAAVTLLTRLMAACSYLRSIAAPFALDDDLWVVTVAAMATAPKAQAASLDGLYSEFEDMTRSGGCGGLPEAVRRHAAALDVADRALLTAWLCGPPGGVAPPDVEVC
jgi:hypothetical protein